MWKKLRFYFALSRAFAKRDKRKITYSLIFLLLLIFALRILLPSSLPKLVDVYREAKKPTFIEGVVGKPIYPNPIFDTTETQKDISKLVFRGLLKTNSEGELIADLAKSYVQVGDKEYVFTLRDDVYWHDGYKFTSEDVLYTIKTIQDPAYQSPLEANFRSVQMEKITDYKIKMKLKESFAPFPYSTTLGILPAHISLKRYRPVGTGDFRLKEIGKDKVVLTNEALNLVFKFYENIEDAKFALKKGEIHAVGSLSPQEVEALKNFGGKNLHSAVLHRRLVIVFFNLKDEKLNDELLRKALSFAVNKEAIKNLAGGTNAMVATSQLPLKNWVGSQKERYPFNLAQAQQFLLKAGYKKVEGRAEKDGKQANFTLTSINDPELNSVVNLLKEEWAALGIKINSRLVNVEELRNNLLPNRNFEILVNFQEIPADPDQYVLWHTTQIQNSNITGISSPQLDKLLEDSRKLADRKQRQGNYKLFTTLLVDSAPAIFLYHPQYTWVVSNKVSGIDFSEFTVPGDRFSSYRGWRIKKSWF